MTPAHQKLSQQMAREWYERKRRLEEERQIVFQQVFQQNARIRFIERREHDRRNTTKSARVS